MNIITLEKTLVNFDRILIIREFNEHSKGPFEMNGFIVCFAKIPEPMIRLEEKNLPDFSYREPTPASITLPLPVKGFTNYFHRLEPQYPNQFVYQMTETMGSNVRVIPSLEHTTFSRGTIIPIKGSRFLYGGIAPRNEEMFVEELKFPHLEVYKSGDIEKFVREYWGKR